jgi:hypothetical protein
VMSNPVITKLLVGLVLAVAFVAMIVVFGEKVEDETWKTPTTTQSMP